MSLSQRSGSLCCSTESLNPSSKDASLKPLINTDLDVPLFPTQKRERFSNNTLAQHFSYLDKSIWQRFVIQQATKKASIAGHLMSSLSGVQ
jgi:hypothetical protein